MTKKKHLLDSHSRYSKLNLIELKILLPNPNSIEIPKIYLYSQNID